MKPFVWGAAIESRRFTPATVVYDTPEVYRDPWTGKEWKPRNFEKDEFAGPLLFADALADSKNTVAVKTVGALGVDPVIGFSRRLGLTTDLPRNLTLALGTGEVFPIELVNAYASIAAGGEALPPVLVLRVRDRTGNVLEEYALPAPPPAPLPDPAATSPAPAPVPVPGEDAQGVALPSNPEGSATLPELALPATGTRPDVAYVLTAMLRGVVDHGTGVAAKRLERPVAGKTGTAQEHRDAWFVGFTPDLVAGVWVGFDDHAPLGPRETGAGAALPPWISFMEAAVGGRPARDFGVPPGVELARIDPASGLLAHDDRADLPFVPFLAGTAPTTTRPESAPESFFQDDR
jgi:penicillin-binding protein 1A